MKKLFAIFAFTAMLAACNDTAGTTDAGTESTSAASTGDSLAAIKVPEDTAAMKQLDSLASVKPDSTITIDSTKK